MFFLLIRLLLGVLLKLAVIQRWRFYMSDCISLESCNKSWGAPIFSVTIRDLLCFVIYLHEKRWTDLLHLMTKDYHHDIFHLMTIDYHHDIFHLIIIDYRHDFFCLMTIHYQYDGQAHSYMIHLVNHMVWCWQITTMKEARGVLEHINTDLSVQVLHCMRRAPIELIIILKFVLGCKNS
jgi:hypothetical protein